MAAIIPALSESGSYPYWETQRDALKGGPLAVIAQLVTPVTKHGVDVGRAVCALAAAT
jgi:hypothetical protein